MPTVHRILHFIHQHYMPAVLLLIVVCFGGGALSGYSLAFIQSTEDLRNPAIQGEMVVKEYPLMKYAFSELKNRQQQSGPIELKRVLAETPEFTSYVFYYTSEGKRISGQLNIPKNSNQELPVLVMVRGFVHEDEYEIGAGSKGAAAEFAKRGYITVAPDFLGFGESEPQPADSLEARYVKAVNILDLISAVEKQHLQPLIFNNKTVGRFNAQKLGMWGHSNGGQIALSVLEVTGRPIPTVLWAPVTKPFPYSVLYFTDESEDLGKALRYMLAEFEKDYDINEFSIGQHLQDVTAPMQVHQGSADDAVPQSWTDDFYSLMAGKGKKDLIEYFTYPGDNHGLTQNWAAVVERSLRFFNSQLTAVDTIDATLPATESALLPESDIPRFFPSVC